MMLTARQREVVKLVAAGADRELVGKTLGISQATVNRHIQEALKRTGARTTVHLVAMTIRSGEID